MKEKINWTLNLFTPMLSLIILTLKSPYRYAAGPSSININGSCSWQWLVEVAFHNSDAGIKRQTWEGRSRVTVFAQPAGWRPLSECCSRLPLAKCGDSGAARELPTAPRKSMGFKTKSGHSNTWISHLGSARAKYNNVRISDGRCCRMWGTKEMTGSDEMARLP